MNRETAQKLWPVIKAWSEGETVQFKSKSTQPEHWSDLIDSEVSFTGTYCDWRIKPKPREFWVDLDWTMKPTGRVFTENVQLPDSHTLIHVKEITNE